MFIRSTVSGQVVASARRKPPREQAVVPLETLNPSPKMTAAAILLIAAATVPHCELDAPEYTISTSSPANEPHLTGVLVGKFESHRTKILLISSA